MTRLDLPHRSNNKWLAFAAIAVGTFTSVMTHGSAIVALPTIAEYFKTDLPTVQWVVIGETLTISALLLPMGRLSDIVGRKQVYIAGLAIFTIGGALAGFSPSITTLIISKVLQGCGAAMSQGTAMAMVTSLFPSAERGKALGMQMSVVGSGGVVGPVIGGLLVSYLGWRWVFFINVPLGILAFTAALIILDKRLFIQDNPQTKFDWLGAALSTGTLVIFLLAITNGYRVGWASLPIIGAILIFATLLTSFIWWELRTPAPMLDLRLFKRKLFSLGVLAGFLSFFGISSVRFLIPFYFQNILGYSPGQIGLILVPNALSMIIMGPISGRLSDRYGWRIFNVGGMALSAAGLFLLSGVTETSSLGFVMTAVILQSSGAGVFNSPNTSSIFSASDPRRHGVVSALLSLTRNSANITSIGVATAIVTATMVSMGYTANFGDVSGVGSSGIFQAFTIGMHRAYLTLGSLLVVGIVISFLKGDRVKEDIPQQVEQPAFSD